MNVKGKMVCTHPLTFRSYKLYY